MEIFQIAERLWNGSIPVRITFQNENPDTSAPTAGGETDVFLEVLRSSYFPLYFDKIVAYFKHYTPALATGRSIWLEYDDGVSSVPIQWHLPIGLLYDSLYTASASLPPHKRIWTLKLRYTGYPSKHIIQSPSTVHLKQIFMNQMKQSSFVLYGNSKLIMGLPPQKSDDLWNSIVNHDRFMYNSVNKGMVLATKIQRVPVKLYISGTSVVIQAPIYPVVGGHTVTLKDVLQEHTPTLFGPNGVAGFKVCTHGIDVSHLIRGKPASVPSILELWEMFKNVDNFLYIVIKFSDAAN